MTHHVMWAPVFVREWRVGDENCRLVADRKTGATKTFATVEQADRFAKECDRRSARGLSV